MEVEIDYGLCWPDLAITTFFSVLLFLRISLAKSQNFCTQNQAAVNAICSAAAELLQTGMRSRFCRPEEFVMVECNQRLN